MTTRWSRQLTTRGTFLGKPLEEMTCEELMDAVVMLGKQLDSARQDNINTINFMREVWQIGKEASK